jgi:hypothetical protein
MGNMKRDELAEYVKKIKTEGLGDKAKRLSDEIKKDLKGKPGVKSKASGGMMGGGKKNYKTTGMLGAKTGKLVGGQKNLPGHLKKAILA